jgi:FtsZ-interacting cell division protein ZipA
MKKKLSILLIALVACLLFTSCKSREKTLRKKSEKVSELKQQDLEIREKIKADVSTFRISEKDQVIITPMDNEKSVQVIKGKDTLQFNNAKIDINSSRDQEQITDKSETEKSSREKNVSEKESELQEKDLDKKSTGTSPALIWGLIIAALVVGAFFYFKKKIPFL